MNLIELFNQYGITLTNIQADMFEKYFDFLILENEKYNLTGITEKDEVFVKHFLDSVLPVNLFENNTNVLDIGAGAGFPSIPLAILRPDISFTLIDCVNKKINFLNQLVELLNLNNVVAIHTRCEDFAKTNREKFDYVVARAVAPMNTLLEYMTPLAKINGRVVMYKGDNYLTELNECENVIKLFHVKHCKTIKYDLGECGKRNILIYQKLSQTPLKYPRNGNKPRLDPLL